MTSWARRRRGPWLSISGPPTSRFARHNADRRLAEIWLCLPWGYKIPPSCVRSHDAERSASAARTRCALNGNLTCCPSDAMLKPPSRWRLILVHGCGGRQRCRPFRFPQVARQRRNRRNYLSMTGTDTTSIRSTGVTKESLTRGPSVAFFFFFFFWPGFEKDFFPCNRFTLSRRAEFGQELGLGRPRKRFTRARAGEAPKKRQGLQR